MLKCEAFRPLSSLLFLRTFILKTNIALTWPLCSIPVRHSLFKTEQNSEYYFNQLLHSSRFFSKQMNFLDLYTDKCGLPRLRAHDIFNVVKDAEYLPTGGPRLDPGTYIHTRSLTWKNPKLTVRSRSLNNSQYSYAFRSPQQEARGKQCRGGFSLAR